MRKRAFGGRSVYPACAKCEIEIDPNQWDGCDKYYIVNDEILCEDCFKDWVRDWIETSLEDVAAVLDVPVVEVR